MIDSFDITPIYVLFFSRDWGGGGGCYLRLPFLFPSIITAAVPHFSLKGPFLTEISVPSVMTLIMCCSTCSFGCNYVIHVLYSTFRSLNLLVGTVSDHLNMQLLTLSVFGV